MNKQHYLQRAVLWLALAASGAPAQPGIDDPGAQLVHHFVTHVITLQSRFEQSLVDAQGAVIEKVRGTLEIERPSRFRWSYAEPYEQWLVADGLNIWSYDLDLEQVTVQPQARVLAMTPALLLSGSENALEQFTFGGTTVEQVTTWVRLQPKDAQSGFNRVELGFVDGELRRLRFFDKLGQTTIVALYDVKLNEPIATDRFEFHVPDGVDLVGTPAIADRSRSDLGDRRSRFGLSPTGS